MGYSAVHELFSASVSANLALYVSGSSDMVMALIIMFSAAFSAET
jgi:hypothetical protein